MIDNRRRTSRVNEIRYMNIHNWIKLDLHVNFSYFYRIINGVSLRGDALLTVAQHEFAVMLQMFQLILSAFTGN
jgi:hypothetical protein